MATNISFNTSEKEYVINGDEARKFKVNVTDVNIWTRYNQVTPDIIALSNKPHSTPEDYTAIDHELRDKLNYIFNTDVCTAAFGDVNCLSPVSDGRPLFAAFLDSFLVQFKQDAEAAGNVAKIRLNNKTDLYAGQVSSKPVLNTLPTAKPNLTPEQESFLRSLLDP